MARTFTPVIVSANDLFAGDVVYLGRNGGWTRHLSEAVVAESQAAADALMTAATQTGLVIGPALVGVQLTGAGAPVPIHFRELFRERGPSTRPDLGRQAEGGR